MSIFTTPANDGTQGSMMRDPKWRGVPPVGNRPVANKWFLLRMILIVFMVKIVIWTIYRLISGNVYPFTDPVIGDWVDLFGKPLFQLGPVFILWWFMFREDGSPFRFTRKNLASSIGWGCVGGLIFFVVATLVFVIQMKIMGQGSDFHIVAGWDEVGWAIVISSLFTYMLSTGPAEELFSRGFIQDQASRAFSLGTAIMISALLFAVGHLPVSIFVHQMGIVSMIWYMVSLTVMGIFFSILYYWSRNIVLVIIIHGLWDWYLTLFALKGAYSPSFLEDAAASFGQADFINTILTLAIMLPFFYLIYRLHWRGGAENTGIIRRLGSLSPVRWMRERDLGDWPGRPWLTTVALTGLFCLAMLPLAGVIGTDVEEYKHDRIIGGGTPVPVYTEGYFTRDGGLTEGETAEYEIPANGSYVVEVDINLRWKDEPDIGRMYENQPDRFDLSIVESGKDPLESVSGDSGKLNLKWALSPGENFTAPIIIVVTLVEAGDQEGRIIGLLGQEDLHNDFSLEVKYRTVRFTSGSGGDADVRWRSESIE